MLTRRRALWALPLLLAALVAAVLLAGPADAQNSNDLFVWVEYADPNSDTLREAPNQSAGFWVRVRPATSGGTINLPITVWYHVSSQGNATSDAGYDKRVEINNVHGAGIAIPVTDDDQVTKDSRITVTLEIGNGYQVDYDRGASAFVFVEDDDDPSSNEPPPEERASVSAHAIGTVNLGDGVVQLPTKTEGQNVHFRITARPFLTGGKVRLPLTVRYKITEPSGNFIAESISEVTLEVANPGDPPLQGEARKQVSVHIPQDKVSEDDSTVTIEILPGTGYQPSSTHKRATARILDDDTPKVRFGADSLGVSEDRTAQCVTGGGETPGSFVVPHDWPLAPEGLSPGSKFRLLFVTSGARDATSGDINVYNQFVQAAARAGHSALSDGCADRFKVVGSTDTIDALDNTLTRSSDVGASIFWLGGDQVADDYADFYDGTWDSRNYRTESAGTRAPGSVFTGSKDDGTQSTFGPNKFGLGAASPTAGHLRSHFKPLSGFSVVSGSSLPFYGLSPVFELEGMPVLHIDPAPHKPLYVRLTTSDGRGGQWGAQAGDDYTAGSVNVTIPADTTFMRVDLGAEGITIIDDEGAEPVDAQTGPTANSDGSYTVPNDWPLKPAGLNPGDEFRLVFITNSRHTADSSDIATYDTHVQNAIANRGHTAIRAYGSLFKVVGSTNTVDARDHTRTNPGDPSHVDAPVYWLNGEIVAAGKSGFWSPTWENWAWEDRRVETGGQPGGRITTTFTGTGADGRKDPARYLGATPLVVHGTYEGGIGAISPMTGTLAGAPLDPKALYGISPRFRVGGEEDYESFWLTLEADPSGYYTVPRDWPLKPAGLNPGDQFRLLFITSTRHNADSSDIAHYDAIVQNAITNNGHADVRAYGSLFKVVGSTSTVDARDHTRTNPGDPSHQDAPVYWLNGEIVAAGKSRFWSPTWENWAYADRRAETGGGPPRGVNFPWTGTGADGRKDPARYLGATPLVVLGTYEGSFGSISPMTGTLGGTPLDPRALYGISPRFRVGEEDYASFRPTLEAEGPAYLVGRDGNS